MTTSRHFSEMTHLFSGDSIYFTESLSHYATWSISYRLVGPQAISLVATEEPSGIFTVSVSSSISAGYLPGLYSWSAIASLGTERVTLATGKLTVLPNPAAAAAGDQRSHARKVLEAIEAVLERRATEDHLSYTIAGRSLSKIPHAELFDLRQKYRALVIAEERAERLAQGRSSSATIKVRL